MANTNRLSDSAVREALTEVPYPGMNRDIVSFGMVRAVSVRGDRVQVTLVLSTAREEIPDLLRSAVRERLVASGAKEVDVELVPPERQSTSPADPWANRGRLAPVRRIVAVGAGKGGVGKSTVAANLALALQAEGMRVGLMDADIYGPSIPMILGIDEGARQIRMTPDKKIIPLEIHGMTVVSFGFFLGPDSPAVWRGPMVSKAVKQFSRGVVWPELDVLVVDLPPGTGDIPLSLAQSVVVDGAVVVTTPQRLAVQEAEKAVEMFRKLDVPVLGVVENMSYAVCACGNRSHPFGRGGGEALARRTSVPALGQIPFDATVGEGEDRGAPPMLEHPDGLVSGSFLSLAGDLVNALGLGRPESQVSKAS